MICCFQLIGLVFIFIFAVFGMQFFADRAEVQFLLCSQREILFEQTELCVAAIVWDIQSSCDNTRGYCCDDPGAFITQNHQYALWHL
jgi:hypothetical protein